MRELNCKSCLIRFTLLLSAVLCFYMPSHSSENTSNSHYINQLYDTIRISNKQIVYDTVYNYEYVYDTLYVYDTIYVDSLPTPYNPESFAHKYPAGFTQLAFPIQDSLLPKPFLPTTNSWYLMLGLNGFLFQNIPTFKGNNSANFEELFARSLTPLPGYAIDFSLGRKINPSWSVQAGFSFSQYREDFYQRRNFSVPDSFSTIQDTSYFTQIFDTISIYNTDALLQGDSTQFIEYPYTYWDEESISDTNWVRNDSLINDTISYQSTWSLIEIPLMVGYTFNFGSFPVQLQTGIIPAWLIREDRYLLYPNETPFNGKKRNGSETEKFQVNFSFSFNITFPLSRQFSLVAEPWIKVPVYQYNKSQVVVMSQASQGLRIGLRYDF